MSLNIVAISGSLSKNSAHNGLLRAICATQSPELKVVPLTVGDWPLVNPDLLEKGWPEYLGKARELVAHADGLLILTPEDNLRVSAVTKNAYDWLSIPNEGKSPVGAIPVGLISANLTDGRHVIEHVEQMVAYCKCQFDRNDSLIINLADQNNFDNQGNVISGDLKNRIQNFMHKFGKFTAQHRRT